MSAEAGPPLQPPQLSPDGKYVWDGSQWQPIAGMTEATHAGVFPSWDSIQVDPSNPAAGLNEQASPVQAPVQMQPVVPAIDYSYANAEPSTPLWQQPNKGVSTYLYFGGGLVVLLMAMIVLNSLNLVQLPFLSAGSSSPVQTAKPSPTPDYSGTDYDRADRFLNGSVAPALVNLDKTIPGLLARCDVQVTNTALSNTCFIAINASDEQAKNLITAVQAGDIPTCIAAPMAKALADMQGMEKQLQVAVVGFQDNSADGLATGIYRFKTFHQLTIDDLHAAIRSQKADCHRQVLPTWVP